MLISLFVLALSCVAIGQLSNQDEVDPFNLKLTENRNIPPIGGEREGVEKGKQISCFTGLKYFLERNVYAKKKGA
jgi:hypothetical protein